MKNNFLSRPVAPATYLGFQEGLPAYGTRPALPGIELWNLTEALPDHPAGSTVAKATLRAHGFITAREALTEAQMARQAMKNSFRGGFVTHVEPACISGYTS